MTAPETRLVLLEPREVDRQLGFTTEQQAIPWCTTHDRQADPETLPYKAKYCFEAGSDEHPCVISTGPPDHYWWKDS